MSKKSNPTVIGAFVVGAVALLAISVALFGGSEYFAERQYYVAYFDEDSKGLRVGSNVLLNGVRIGFVSDIALLMDEETYASITRATLEILPDTFFVTKFGKIMGTGSRDVVGHEELIENGGLRAQLASQSFVTGQLVVSLSLRPETEFIMRGIDPEYPEIPTVPSGTAELMNKLQSFAMNLGENLDVEEIGAHISGILKGVDEVANSEDLRNMLAGANKIVNDDDTQKLTASLRASIDEIRVAAASASSMMRNADGQIEVLAADLKPAVSKLVSVVTEAEETLAAAKDQMRGESVQMYQLEATLTELEGAATAIRQFFDYLERHPEALLSGK